MNPGPAIETEPTPFIFSMLFEIFLAISFAGFLIFPDMIMAILVAKSPCLIFLTLSTLNPSNKVFG